MANCMECIHIDVCIKAATSHIDHCSDYSFAGNTVEVVRCRECHCYTPVDNRIGKCVFLIGEHQYVVPNGYCYLGERKDGDGNG